MQFNLSRVIGPTLAGFMIAAGGESGLLPPQRALVRRDPDPSRPSRRCHGARAGSAAPGWIFGSDCASPTAIRSLPSLLAISAAIAVFGTPAVTLAPLFARRLLGVGPEGLGGMLSAVGIGAVATALLLAWLGDFPGKGRGVVVAAAAFAVALAGFAWLASVRALARFLAILGGAMMSASSLINTLMQKRAPDRLRGRVISLYVMAWLGLVPLGNLQAAAIAQKFGAAPALFVGAVGIAGPFSSSGSCGPVPADLR